MADRDMNRDVMNGPGMAEQAWVDALADRAAAGGAARAAALTAFADLGLPDRRREGWRWTDLNPLRSGEFTTVAPKNTGKVPPELLSDPFAVARGHRLVFVNGYFREDLSDTSGLPEGVLLGSLAAAGEQCDPFGPDTGFSLLNQAGATDGALVRVAPGVALSRPVHLQFVNMDGGCHMQTQVKVELGQGARATLFETHDGVTDAAYFASQLATVSLADGARLDHYRLQDEAKSSFHFRDLRAALAAQAGYESFTLSTGARLSRNSGFIRFDGAEAECGYHGAYLLGGMQQADTVTQLQHAAPECVSAQNFRGVLDDRARGTFQGCITVEKPAQRTDAQQSIKALLLSPRAEQDAKPELEIFADDVKCAHGASTGNLDPDALFYLRARGIPQAQARALLIEAFVSEVLDNLSAVTLPQDGAGQLRDGLRARMEMWLAENGTGE